MKLINNLNLSITITILLLLMLLTNSCVIESQNKIFLANTGNKPFKNNVILYNDGDDNYTEISCNTDKCIEKNNYTELIYYQFNDSNKYIFQYESESNGKKIYNYIFAKITSDTLSFYDFEIKNLSEITGIEYKIANVDKKYLITTINYIINNKEKFFLESKIYDATDIKTITEINNKIIIAKEKNKIKNKENENKIPNESGRWKYIEKFDIMDDTKKQYIAGSSDNFEGSTISPLIYINCINGNNMVSIDWNSSINPINESNDDLLDTSKLFVTIVDVRFDNKKLEKLLFALSNNNHVTYEVNEFLQNIHHSLGKFLSQINSNIDVPIQYWNGKAFVKALNNSEKIIIRARLYNGNNVTAIFSTKGFKDVVKNFPSSCQ